MQTVTFCPCAAASSQMAFLMYSSAILIAPVLILRPHNRNRGSGSMWRPG
jgi:hypothetical protein